MSSLLNDATRRGVHWRESERKRITRRVNFGMIKNSRIFITGATGFIGGRLAERLVWENNHNQILALVRDLSRVSRLARFVGIDMIKGDILDLSNLLNVTKGCNIILHCAFGNKGDEKYQEKVTVEGTRNVCEAALKNKSKLVYLSSIAVYGDNPPEIVDEKTPLGRANDIYTKSKLRAERICLEYMKKYSLAAAIIRPAVVYGPYSPVWTLNPIEKLKEKKLFLIEHGNGLCNHLYIDNLVDAIFLAALSGKSNGEAYVISDGSAVTWRKFYSFYRAILNEMGIENEWISLSKKELLDIVNQRKRLVYNIKGVIRTSLINESFNREIDHYPLVGNMKELIKRILPEKALSGFRDLRRAYRTDSGINEMSQIPDPPIPRDINFFSLRSAFSIEKAKRDLGYSPMVSLQEGMDRIKQWYCTLF